MAGRWFIVAHVSHGRRIGVESVGSLPGALLFLAQACLVYRLFPRKITISRP